MIQRIFTLVIVSFSLFSLIGPGCVSDPLPNGDFETGVLDPWVGSGVNSGYSAVVEQGTRFSANPTEKITFENPIYAANIRSSGPAPTNSIGILTSPAFQISFPAINFIALSETTGNRSNPVTLTYRLLNQDGSVLFESAQIQTAVVNLDSAVDTEGWSSHCIDLSGFAGLTVQLQFQQHTNYTGQGYFTLLDAIDESQSPCPEE